MCTVAALPVLFIMLLGTLLYRSNTAQVWIKNQTITTEASVDGSQAQSFLQFFPHSSAPLAMNSSVTTQEPDSDTELQDTDPEPRTSAAPAPKSLNLSSLLYVPRKPYLTVLTKDIAKDDRVALDVSIAYEHHVTCKWYLNSMPFHEYDTVWARDIKSFQASNRTFHIRVCHIEVMHLLKLPTPTGSYDFACSILVDNIDRIVGHQLEFQTNDSCPPANCSDRNAVCRSGKCVCDPVYPVRLNSVHTTCRRRSFLGERCIYDSQCVYTAKNSECVDKGWCACKLGYGRNQWRQCTPKYGLNARCDSDTECQKVNGSCILSHCSCVAPAVEENTRCMDAARWFDVFSSGTPCGQTCAAMILMAAALLVALQCSEVLNESKIHM